MPLKHCRSESEDKRYETGRGKHGREKVERAGADLGMKGYLRLPVT